MKASPMVWTGRALSALFVLFMLGASVAPKFLMPDASLDYIRSLNIDPEDVPLIGVIELVGTLLYAWRRTAVAGAVWMTALLGGAIATHLHVDSPLFSHTLFGAYLGLVMWGGLWLRDPSLRALLPVRRDAVAAD
jgi:hypothetical protein